MKSISLCLATVDIIFITYVLFLLLSSIVWCHFNKNTKKKSGVESLKNWCYSSYLPPFTLNHISQQIFPPCFLDNTVDWLVSRLIKRGCEVYDNAIVIHDHQFFLRISSKSPNIGLWKNLLLTLKNFMQIFDSIKSKTSIKNIETVICLRKRIENSSCHHYK